MTASYRVACAIARQEALVTVPYPDGKTGYSQGLGHFGVKPDAEPWTVEHSWAVFLDDVKERSRIVGNYIDVPMNQNEEDALVHFYFQAGNKIEVVAKLINDGEPKEAMSFLLTHNRNEAGEFRPGLARRRYMERRMFLFGDYGDETAKLKVWRGDPHTTAFQLIDFPPEGVVQ